MLLGSVLFLTEIWHYSTLRAGVAITPAPLLVVVLSGPAGSSVVRSGSPCLWPCSASARQVLPRPLVVRASLDLVGSNGGIDRSLQPSAPPSPTQVKRLNPRPAQPDLL